MYGVEDVLGFKRLVGSVRRRLLFQPRDHVTDQTLDLRERIVAVRGLGVHRGSNTRCELRQLDRLAFGWISDLPDSLELGQTSAR